MDTGEGYFKEINDKDAIRQIKDLMDEHPTFGGLFKKGEILQIRGSFFKVKKITPKDMVLHLMPKNEAIANLIFAGSN